MNKAIFFKEWIKTRGLFFITLLVSLCFAGYVMMRINRVITLWAILLSRDTVFIELLQYLPLIIGALFASSQFIPEMTQKRLKLTLHLPYPQQRMILLMLLAGVSQISIVFLLQAASLWIYLQQHIACEMVARILLTAAPWYICGYTAYLMTAWICLEPTWKLRIVNLLIAAGIVRIFFLLDKPEAYNSFLPTLIIFTILCASLSIRSVVRFKEGCQD